MIEPQYDKSIEFLQAFRTGGPWVLTAIKTDKKGIETASFAGAEVDEVRTWLEEHGDDHNIYFSVNPTIRAVNKKAEREDIRELAYLHVDIDPRAGEDIEAERARALERLTTDLPESIPPPTFIVDSGGGYHGYWLLDEPLPIDGESAKYEEAARYNMQIEVLFDGDSCHNVDRIMRLPGTVNRPDKNKLAKGRTTRLATLVEHHPDRIYSLGDFTPAPLVQQTEDFGFSGGGTNLVKIESDNIQRLDHVDDLGDEVPAQCKIVIVQGNDPDDPSRFPSRSEALFYVCCQLVRSGVPDEVIYSVITDEKFGIAESVLETGRRAHKYAIRQIEQAKEDAIDPKLRELNAKHAVIEDIDGKCRIISESFDDSMDRTVLSYQTFQDFQNRYSNRLVSLGEDKEIPLGVWWIRHNQRRQYDRIVFAPGREVPDAFNLWRGFSVEAKPGKCELFLEHVRRNVCRDDERVYRYLIGWMARAVQRPDEQGHVAIVMRGKKGAGKGKFASTFGRLFGRHFLQLVDAKHLVGNFNAHLRDCSVLFADEAFYAGDKKHESILKSLITEDTLMVEGKGVNAMAVRNYLHIIMASNEDWVIPTGAHERRFLMLDVSDTNLQDRKFFKAIDAEQENGGREALLHYLLHYDLSEFDVRDVPKTDALREQQIRSMPPEEEWWFTKLEAGEVFTGDGWPKHVICTNLAHDFITYMRTFNTHMKSGGMKLGHFLRKVLPNVEKVQLGTRVNVITESGDLRTVDRPRAYVMPTLEEARAAFDAKYGGVHKWPDNIRTVSNDQVINEAF